jgi:hypothetical protein
MKTLRFTSKLLGLAILALAFTSIASAQATRTWVSGVGDDANPCSRTAPCKTFAGAISKTAVNGEIDCLDPGGFGAVTITKSITINCDQVGGILPGATNAININAAGGVVTLRGLDLQGVGQGINGVNVIAASFVHLIDMNIYGFTTTCVNVAAASTVNLTIRDSQLYECGSTAGIQTSTSSGFVIGDFDHVAIYNTAIGVNASTGSHLNIQRSDIFQCPIGVNIPNGATGSPTVGATGNTFSFDGVAFQATTGGNIGAATNFITSSVTVFNPNGGTISTASDNVSYQNAGPGMANGPAITKI